MPKPDAAHLQTDKELAKLEKRIAKIYKEAADDLQKTIDDYFAKFAKRDAKQKARLEAGEITEQEYKQWRLAQMGRGERFKALQSRVAERYTEANETAVRYVNDATPGIYSLNRNYSAYTIEKVAGNVGFDLWDEQTVRRLIVDNPEVMPYYPPEKALKRGIDLAYGKKQISASVTSSILQGKSIPGIAKDLQTRMPEMNKSSAIRTARTAVTGAQNAGRMDSYVAAEKMGIKVRKEWLATLDGRTRHSHAMLDGKVVDKDKKFENGCMFPGDPNGPAYEVYNCRCTLIAAVDVVDTSDAKRRVRNPETGKNELVSDMTYSEWAGWKEKQPKKIAKPVFTPAKTIQEAEKYAKNELNFEVADFGETTVDVANEINRVIGKIFDKYPEIEIDRIISGQTNARYTLAMHKTSLVQKTGKLTKGTLEIGNVQKESFLEVENILSKSVKSGFFVKTDAGYLETRIWHESGHQYGSYIESELFKKRFPDFETNDKAYTSYLKEVLKKQFYKDVLKEAKADMKKRGLVFDVKNISQYASTNQSEMFAEAFAEINCSKNPSEEAKTIIRIAEGKLK